MENFKFELVFTLRAMLLDLLRISELKSSITEKKKERKRQKTKNKTKTA